MGARRIPAEERSNEKAPTVHDVMCATDVGTSVSRPESGSPVLLTCFAVPHARDTDDQREDRDG
jgi:hypothetical protein